MSVLASPPPYYFVGSVAVSLLYLLVAALPPITVLLRRSSDVVKERNRFRVTMIYASILIAISPELFRLIGFRNAVVHWIIECSVIALVSTIATFVFSRRKKKADC